MECSICCETFKENLVFKCLNKSCDIVFCTDCIKTYLLSSNDLPHCMNCKSVFSRSFVISVTNKLFMIGEYKKHREDVLWELEKAKMPEYQLRINYYDDENNYIKNMERNVSSFFNNKIEESKEIFNSFKKVYYGDNYQQYQKYDTTVQLEARKRDARINRFRVNASKARDTIDEYKELVKNYYNGLIINKPEKLSITGYKTENLILKIEHFKISFDSKVILFNKENSKSDIIMCKCPIDNCIGFIINNICSKCKVKVCERCQKVEESSDSDSKIDSKIDSTTDSKIESKGRVKKVHKCLESDVRTVELIKKECKSCPKCHTNIFRVSGCAQMWCTICHTAFDYNTGVILNNKNIHNPHYFEFLNNNNIMRNGGCGDILSKLTEKFKRDYAKNKHFTKIDYLAYFRNSAHILDEDRNYENEKNRRFFDIAKKFIEGEKTEDKYKIAIQRAEKKESFIKEENDIKRQMATINLDILYTYSESDIPANEIDKLLNNNMKIFKKEMKNISNAYGMKNNIGYFNY